MKLIHFSNKHKDEIIGRKRIKDEVEYVEKISPHSMTERKRVLHILKRMKPSDIPTNEIAQE